MAQPWEKRPGETPKAFGAFHDFLQAGPGRELVAVARDKGHRPLSLRTWSSKHDWFDRAAAYDVWELEQASRGWEMVRARVRAAMIADAMDCYQTLRDTMRGRLEPPPCDCDDPRQCMCGAWLPILDRHGEVVGTRPVIAASTRKGAAIDTLDRCGLTVPKRVEHTGADGRELRIQARMMLGALTPGQFDALAAVFDPDASDES